MDRHPQQIKRERQDKKRQEFNVAKMSEMKTAIKRVMESTDAGKADSLYKKAVSRIDKMVSKGHLKKNTAARRKSQISRHLNSLSA
ncbi:MAG: 30S ribosomal protein S20 [Candidatus Marinimicrobia bacterium]|nr:30S ribosomal protein S20 [Candidatus Neomarinimicrobiota bacterium]